MKLRNAAILTSMLLSLGGVANAGTISIGLAASGINGGAITTQTTGTTTASVTNAPYGSFLVNNISAYGTTAPGSLFSNSLNVSNGGAAGTLMVYVTEQGITSPINSVNFLSTLTSNAVPAGWLITEATYFSPTNLLYGETNSLASYNFSMIGTDTINTIGNVGIGPYSITEVYTIQSTGSGVTNNTINLVDPVPEPSTLVLLGASLAFLGFVRLRSQSLKS